MHSDFTLVLFLIGFLVYFMASAGLVPFVARAKGRSRFGWMLSALLFSPLLALIALAAVPPKLEESGAPEAPDIPEFKWQKPESPRRAAPAPEENV